MSDVSSRLGAGHVLIADPNDATREHRQSQLREAGFRVSLARTGFEAIVKACCHVPDWILIDASLTGHRGRGNRASDHHLPGHRAHSRHPAVSWSTSAAAHICTDAPAPQLASPVT